MLVARLSSDAERDTAELQRTLDLRANLNIHAMTRTRRDRLENLSIHEVSISLIGVDTSAKLEAGISIDSALAEVEGHSARG